MNDVAFQWNSTKSFIKFTLHAEDGHADETILELSKQYSLVEMIISFQYTCGENPFNFKENA